MGLPVEKNGRGAAGTGSASRDATTGVTVQQAINNLKIRCVFIEGNLAHRSVFSQANLEAATMIRTLI
jgi:hypothetical protein